MISSQMDVFKKLPYIKSNINSKNAGGETPPSFLRLEEMLETERRNKKCGTTE